MYRLARKKGFTLIETIVASTILCGSVLTIGAICSRSLTGTRLNRRYETAYALINRQLSLIDYLGIDEFLAIGETSGEFEDYGPGYAWLVDVQYEEIDALYSVTITVYWYEHTTQYNVTMQTFLNGISEYADSTATETDT